MLLGIERSAYLSSTTRCCEHRFNKGGVSSAGFQGVRSGAMQDPGYGLPRIPLPRTPVNMVEEDAPLSLDAAGALAIS